jgi:hypothetical protein
MGARPSSFKKGGGFLNNVDGVITGYEFTDVFPGAGGGKSKSDFHTLYCILAARVDGADEDVQTTLFVGDADAFEITDDGHTLVPNDEGYELGANSGFATFIASLCDNGFPDTKFPEDEFNWEAMIGTRVRFKQQINEALTKKLGKRKGKDGKAEYSRTDLVIDAVYDVKSSGAATGKTASKGRQAADTGGVDVDDLTEATIKQALAKAPKGTLPKSKLSMKVLTLLMKQPEKIREAARVKANNDEFLGGLDGITYDVDEQTVSLD